MKKYFFILFPLLFLNFTSIAKVEVTPFNDIIEKYKGKVIYVDFWASWCSPCRKEIKKMKSIKEKYKNQDIVFIYITMDINRTECEQAILKDGTIETELNYYSIDIKKDEKFAEINKFMEIPHYLIYDKKGKLVNQNAPYPSMKNELFNEFDKYIGE
jgi:thiol-disulfide isomerase/thioredoxin